MRRVFLPIGLLLACACGGSSSGPGPTPTVPVQNAAPVIQNLTAATPSGRTEADTDIDISTTVTDAETAVASLTLNWTASAGTITGTGSVVKWRLTSGTATTPVDVVIRLEVVERYANYTDAGTPITSEHRVTREISFRAFDSRSEISRIAVRFLRDLFGNSAVSPETAVADFWDGCGGKQAELEETRLNRQLFVILEASASVQSITFTGADDADVVAMCRWRDRVLRNGSTGVSQGACLLHAVFRQDRWWLCQSTVDRTGEFSLFTRTCDDGTASCIPPSAVNSYRYRIGRF